MWPFSTKPKWVNAYLVVLPEVEQLQRRIAECNEEAKVLYEEMKRGSEPSCLKRIELLKNRAAAYLAEANGMARAASLIQERL